MGIFRPVEALAAFTSISAVELWTQGLSFYSCARKIIERAVSADLLRRCAWVSVAMAAGRHWTVRRCGCCTEGVTSSSIMRCSLARARARRDMTVPIGTPRTRAASA